MNLLTICVSTNRHRGGAAIISARPCPGTVSWLAPDFGVVHGEFSGGVQVFGAELSKGLPTKLAKEPLVDAVFEMRFESDMPVSSIWPGILYSELSGAKSMESLPAVGVPKEFRDTDPSLMYAPLCKISWGDYWILIGDRVFAVASKVPYPGWDGFKKAILKIYSVVLRQDMIRFISRCSIKYVDILEGIPIRPADCFNLQLTLGGRLPHDNDFHVRLGFEEAGITHTLQIASEGKVRLDSGLLVSGPVVDADSVMTINDEDATAFLQQLEVRIDVIHAANKCIVFDCLSAQALSYLEPSYE